MSLNILITGATGYIGGSVLSGLLSSEKPRFEKSRIFVAVRSERHVKTLTELGVKVALIDLTDEASVREGVLNNDSKTFTPRIWIRDLSSFNAVDFIIHTASALEPAQAKNLITALGKRHNATKKDVFFIHTSGTSAWSSAFGSTYGLVKDTDPLFEKEKAIADSFPVRQTDVTVIEEAEKAGVTSYIIPPPIIYGRGDGPWNKMSAMIPATINAAISRKVVEKFPTNARTMGTHITDLTAYYLRLIEKILEGADLPSGKQGYYFPIAHRFSWWDVLDKIAKALQARNLVKDSELREWPSYDAAAEGLSLPAEVIPRLYVADNEVIGENKSLIGWEPEWDEHRFLTQMDDEIKNFLDLGIEKVGLLAAVSQELSKK
ncbi:unnamed protein product [Clonostachys byssicola]|uniref:NmrA-like domain-containing protein n=1 Tax=Clonostachys byssicola TaxID=160290 RepID=A0A9N9UA76_9HYPO|nr:unnamed protein product [Clonostachys byssicola]